MNDLIRSGIYTGVGATVLAKKKLEEFVEEMIQNNDLTQDDGKRIVQDLIRLAEDRRNELEVKVTNAIDELLFQLKMPGRNEIEVYLSDWMEKLKSGSFSISGSPKEKNKPIIS